ncbi:glycosyltransferase family 4 protein [Spirosoma foliorum]|uniref:Glycosyltransferase family 4 protein n=1 Tax=Spirosoma foliorum TaxID=2710596 RepID=A0A7G5H622_9BACT|nr:glycosyltransferase family 4 protein [Spirosoma foliorum]QMW06564.1 glycosyltransferase family 4 protein [Spirosoma foliorum]
MARKRIAVLIYGGVGVGIGSEGVVCLVKLCETIARDYDLTVFSMVRIDDNYQPNGYQLIGTPFSEKRSTLVRMAYIGFKMLQQHRQKKYSIIHAFWAYPAGFWAIQLANFLRLKTIVTFMGGEVANLSSINYGLYQTTFKRKLIQQIARHANVVVALTQHHSRKITTKLTVKQLVVIPFGVDLAQFSIVPKLLKPPYRFLYVGNLNRVKDIPTLLHTFQRISQQVDARLDLIGLDTLHGEMQLLAKKLGLADTVYFHGYQPNNQLQEWLAKTHILLHTSLWESQAVVVNEAIASGVVVCGTRVGLIADLEGTATIAAAVGDANELAQKVLQLVDDPTHYEELRKNGIAWSKRHDWKIQYQCYSGLYQMLAAI